MPANTEAYPVYTGYMCECCWRCRDIMRDGAYADELKRHEERGCPCTKPGIEGARRRAGQWWNEEKQRDVRLEDKSDAR